MEIITSLNEISENFYIFQNIARESKGKYPVVAVLYST